MNEYVDLYIANYTESSQVIRHKTMT